MIRISATSHMIFFKRLRCIPSKHRLLSCFTCQLALVLHLSSLICSLFICHHPLKSNEQGMDIYPTYSTVKTNINNSASLSDHSPIFFTLLVAYLLHSWFPAIGVFQKLITALSMLLNNKTPQILCSISLSTYISHVSAPFFSPHFGKTCTF